MPEFFIKLFASKLFGPLASIALVASLIGNATLGASLFFERRASTKLETRVEELAGDNRTLRGNQATLNAALHTANASIDSLKTAADAAAKSAKAGQAAAEATASALDRNAAAIGKLAPPPPGADRCAAASKLIHDTLAGEHVQ